MALDFFEVSIRDKLGFDNVCSALTECLGVPVENLVNESAYWELSESEREAAVSLRIDFSDRGYGVLITGLCFLDIYDEKLWALALCLSKRLKTDVAVGDYRDEVEGYPDRVAVFSPDGTKAFGIGISDADGSFDVEFLPR
ncbi:hypothetical protein [Pseudomonas sp. TUM22785]|uniref:hypothetical protein n=1 Tax=Pseudomonas sp. TUM22785 TaxID=3019098 RepID=UPI002306B632|nr:hypothetical protein [Pseudomonas sp. TUM22785]WCD82668.1 hypothetical protein PI990_11815 [Pseudomonas sp. TUM22785]